MTIICYCNLLGPPSNNRKIIVVIILKLASYIGSRLLLEPKDRVLIIFTDKSYF